MEYAIQNGKRLIPVVLRNTRASKVPPQLRPLNWIFLRESDDFEAGFAALIAAIRTDYAWLQYLRRLQVRALEWTRSNREQSLLLRGKDLRDAELQLAANASKEEQPTPLQREYLLASRHAADRQRRITTGVTIGVIISLAVLSVYSFVQTGLARSAESTAVANASIAGTERANAVSEANARATAQANAEERTRIARAGELAAQSIGIRERNFPVSLLLGVEAFRSHETVQTRGLLMENAYIKPERRAYLMGQSSWVTVVAFNPDPTAKMLASDGDDNTVILWDIETGEPIGRPLHGHPEGVRTLAFSPDGRWLASGSGRATILLWDVSRQPNTSVETGEPVGVLFGEHDDDVTSVAFSPDGQILASGSLDQTIVLWDVATLQPIGLPLYGHFGYVTSVAFSPDGQILASSSLDKTIILWDVETGEPIGEPLQGHTFGVQSVAFSPDGKILASGSSDHTIMLWNVETGEPAGQPLRGHTFDVFSVAFSPDGRILASASADQTIRLWDVSTILDTDFETEEPLSEVLTGATGNVESIAFSPDGQLLASGSWDNFITLWDVSTAFNPEKETGGPIGQLLNEDYTYIYSVVFSADGKKLAAGSVDDLVILWDVPTIRSTGVETEAPTGQSLNGHTDSVYSVAFSPDGKLLASGGADNTIILWDVETREPIGQPLTGHLDWVTTVAFSPDGKILASGSADTTIILWDVATRQRVGQPLKAHPSEFAWVMSVDFSPDGKTLAAGGIGDNIILWDVSTVRNTRVDMGALVGKALSGDIGNIESVAFSPDGKILASGTDDNIIVLWDLETGQAIGQPLAGHSDEVTSVTFSPDGKVLASSGRDGIFLWDVQTGEPIGQRLGRPAEVDSVAFSPDGGLLVSGGWDGVFLWDLNPEYLIQKTCQRTGRNFTRAEWTHYFPDDEYHATCPQWPAGE
jgi:WD40 repeat protein